MSTHAVERTIPAGGSYQNVVADRKLFQEQNAGTDNAGNTIHLGLGEKIVPLAVKFADAELIKTLEFTRDTITSLYQVPNWMLSANDSQQNVEQQTSVFVSGTMANIANIYSNEIAFKMLSKEEIQKGYTIEFDLDSLKEVTFGDKVTALKDAVNNGLMTPDQANKKLGFEGVPGEFGGYHFTQAQMIPLERYSEFNQLLKDSPNVDKSLTDNRYKNE
ncbi:phage portal protein [Marinilabilia salmonicolor]|nr:phage portal protein [Marinilabilia salmonicolor]